MSAERLTTTETRLVEQYVSVLDLVSRCAQAVERGDWFALCEQTAWLEAAARRLAETVGKAYAAWDADRRAVRAPLVRAAVARLGRSNRAERLLHPAQPPQGGEGR